MEVTKREILFSIMIISVMVGLGIILSNPIISHTTESALKTISSVQVTDSAKFDYIKRTDVGDFLAEGTLTCIDSVSIPDIEGYYGKIEKIKEEYREHTEVITETDSEGHVHTHTETHWEWDEVDKWSYESKHVEMLGQTFTPKEIGYKYHTRYKDTITPKVGIFATRIRYKYYVAPTKAYGVLEGNVENKCFNHLKFKQGETIVLILNSAEGAIDSAPILFWVFWIFFICIVVVAFYYGENNWLEDHKKNMFNGRH